MEFARFLCRPLVDVIPWVLERQTFAQWLSLWQFVHLDSYAGHLSRGLKGCSRPQLLHFISSVSCRCCVCLRFLFWRLDPSFRSQAVPVCDVVALYVLALSMA